MSAVSFPSHHPYHSRPVSFQNVSDRLNRLTHRHLFLRSLVPAIGNLDYGFLVPENASLSLLGDLQEISVVINTDELEDWKTVVTASPFVRKYLQTQKITETSLKLSFQDGSNLNLILVQEFRYRDKLFLEQAAVLADGMIHRDGIKISNICQVVEYHWLKSHATNSKFPIDFRALLLGQSPDRQVEAAQYICSKYNLDSHRLFHLLTHTPTYRKAINNAMGLNSNRNMSLVGFTGLFQLFMLSHSS
ncbi:MAG: hypothetical protein AB8H47_09970 [Bacteroidia bacterium]